jgi:Uma2 family endonuclease
MVVQMLDWDALQPEQMRPLRRAEYDRLVADGVFEDERLELLGGALFGMSPQGRAHIRVSAEIARCLYLELMRLGTLDQFTIQSHSPYAASEISEPEPDVAVVPRGMDLADRCHLLVEVADSSLRRDRGIKARIYAAAEVPEYWIVDLAGRAVEVHTAPVEATYTRRERRVEGDMLQPIALPGVSIPVASILGPP